MSDTLPQIGRRRQSRPLSSLALPAAIVLIVYAATFLLLPSAGVWINDNGCRFIQMLGLAQSGYTAYDVPWPGVALDPTFTHNPLPDPFGHVIDGKLYAQYPPPPGTMPIPWIAKPARRVGIMKNLCQIIWPCVATR